MRDFIIRGLVNTPFKKCVVLKGFYPCGFMVRMVNVSDGFIPDGLYSNVYISNYIILC